MHDVLVHYLEVNFPEIADQLAHARGREPSSEERATAAERLRELIRRLRREAVEPAAPPPATVIEPLPAAVAEPEPLVAEPPSAEAPTAVTEPPAAPPEPYEP